METTTTERTSLQTQLALQAFEKLCKAEQRVDKLRKELYVASSRVPEEEFERYVERTQEMLDKYEHAYGG